AVAEGVWPVPVLKVEAQAGVGIQPLVETLDRHAGYLETTGELARRRETRVVERVRALVDRELRRRVWERGEGGEIVREALPLLATGAESPYAVAARIVAAALPAEPSAAQDADAAR